MKATIGIVGLSHLGLVSAAGIASRGFRVVAYDPDDALVADIRREELPVHEDGLLEVIRERRESLSFTSAVSELSQCDVVYVARDIPTSVANESEVEPVVKLISQVLPALQPDTSLVIHSQVQPGFTRGILPLVTREGRGLQLFYQVETLIFGDAMNRVLNPERYIVGSLNPDSELPPRYSELLAAFDCPVLKMRYESAELAKISINMFLVSSVMTTSTLAELCEKIGADWQEIAGTLRLDRRIGPHAYLSPGLGIAGGNLERDLVSVQQLARQHGTDCGVIDAWLRHSSYRRDWAFRQLTKEVLGKQPEAVIGVWGLAYKPNTHSIKNSPAIALLSSLSGYRVRAYDPKVKLGVSAAPHIQEGEEALDVCVGVDVLVVMTPWPEFMDIPPEEVVARMIGRLIIDPYRCLNATRYSELGISVIQLGSKT